MPVFRFALTIRRFRRVLLGCLAFVLGGLCLSACNEATGVPGPHPTATPVVQGGLRIDSYTIVPHSTFDGTLDYVMGTLTNTTDQPLVLENLAAAMHDSAGATGSADFGSQLYLRVIPPHASTPFFASGPKNLNVAQIDWTITSRPYTSADACMLPATQLAVTNVKLVVENSDLTAHLYTLTGTVTNTGPQVARYSHIIGSMQNADGVQDVADQRLYDPLAPGASVPFQIRFDILQPGPNKSVPPDLHATAVAEGLTIPFAQFFASANGHCP